MVDLSDEERKDVLGEVLADQLKAIFEYVKDIPGMKRDLNDLKQKSDVIDNRLIVVEAVARAHEVELRFIKEELHSIKEQLALA